MGFPCAPEHHLQADTSIRSEKRCPASLQGLETVKRQPAESLCCVKYLIQTRITSQNNKDGLNSSYRESSAMADTENVKGNCYTQC